MTLLLQNIHVELIAEIPSRERFAELADGWLTGVLARVFPDLSRELRERPVVNATHPLRVDSVTPWGEPDHVHAKLTMGFHDPLTGGREVLYSERAWERFRRRLREYPFSAEIVMTPLDHAGFPRIRGGYVPIYVRRELRFPEWVRFLFTAPADLAGWPGSPELQQAWAEFVRQQAGAVGAVSGSMTDDIGGGGDTALERTIWEKIPSPLPRCRDVLRGYSWVTVVPAGLAQRLGGAGALAASGAFFEVSTLPHGSVWLRATPTISEFTEDRIRKVFEVLAPVLVTGRTEDREGLRIVSGVDAADFR